MATDVLVESESVISDINMAECCCGRQHSKSSTSTADTVTFAESTSNACCSDCGGHIIFFDWDDTLFPTTHVFLHCPSLRQLLREETLRPRLAVCTLDCQHSELIGFQACMQTVQSLLHEAASLGQVSIVTMGARGWVEACCRVLMPELLEDMQTLRIKIVYARDTMSVCHARQVMNDGLSVAQACKQRAMRLALRQTSHKIPSPSRAAVTSRSVLGIGDSDAERLALQDVLFRYESIDRKGLFRDCHCKTVKLLEQPGFDTLVAELQILTTWIQRVLRLHGDLDLHFEDLARQDHNDSGLSAGI